MTNGYLKCKLHKSVKKDILQICNAKSEDLCISFWGNKSIQKIHKLLNINKNEILSLNEGNVIQKIIPNEILLKWITDRKKIRVQRHKAINRINRTYSELHSVSNFNNPNIQNLLRIEDSDIISFMDGSAQMWLAVISSAKRDFLKGYENIKKVEKWNMMSLNDVLDDEGNLLKGYEEESTYIIARDFLFDDNYRIDIEYPAQGKTVNYRELLELLIEVCKGNRIDISWFNPTIEESRRVLALESGDPKLIEIYCK